MKAKKEELIAFLEKTVLFPAEHHIDATEIIKKKIRATRMRLNEQKTAKKVEHFFWSAMASDHGIDGYTKIKGIGANTFEDVRMEFKKICGRS